MTDLVRKIGKAVRATIFVGLGVAVFASIFSLVFIPVLTLSAILTISSAFAALLYSDAPANALLRMSKRLIESISGFEPNILNFQLDSFGSRLKYALFTPVMALGSAILATATASFVIGFSIAFKVDEFIGMATDPLVRLLGLQEVPATIDPGYDADNEDVGPRPVAHSDTSEIDQPASFWSGPTVMLRSFVRGSNHTNNRNQDPTDHPLDDAAPTTLQRYVL
ncbi:MAG TPA: hypothetical protein VLG38_01920 [Gammaproteobacteria bacterium]|nr:hypothetical protein [Gammaproteobacteria bacterium]